MNAYELALDFEHESRALLAVLNLRATSAQLREAVLEEMHELERVVHLHCVAARLQQKVREIAQQG